MAYNTSFTPAAMRSPASPGQGLAAAGPRTCVCVCGCDGDDVFVVGDVQTWHLVRQSRKYLAGDAMEMYHGPAGDKVVFELTVGSGPRPGAFQPPSFLIWWPKGRYLGTNYSANYAAGIGSSNGAWPK